MEVFTKDGLTIYDGKIKTYIKENAVGGTMVEPSEINGNLKIDGIETPIYTPQEYYVEY